MDRVAFGQGMLGELLKNTSILASITIKELMNSLDE